MAMIEDDAAEDDANFTGGASIEANLTDARLDETNLTGADLGKATGLDVGGFD